MMKHVTEPPPADSQPKLLAKNMTPDQRKAALESIRRGPPPVPVETSKRASEMSELERRQYLAEHRRRFG